MITQEVITGIHFTVDEQGIGTLIVDRPEVRMAGQKPFSGVRADVSISFKRKLEKVEE